MNDNTVERYAGARRAERLALLAVVAATLASFAYFVLLHDPFTIVTYPFKFPDSWVWLVEALAYLGYDVIGSVLAPVTPLTFAALLSCGAADLIPLRAIICHHAMTPALFLLVRSATNCWRTALLASMLCLTSSSMLGNSVYIGSDVAANMLLLYAVLFFWLGVTRHGKFLWPMAICWGGSALTQYLAFLLVFPFVAFLFVAKRSLLRDPRLLGSFVLAYLIGGSEFIRRAILYGDPLYSRATHLGLVKFHLDDIGQYAWWSLGFFSPLIVVMVFAGVWECVARPTLRVFGAFLAILISSMVVFFVFMYNWPDNRFIQYGAPMAFALAAIGWRRWSFGRDRPFAATPERPASDAAPGGGPERGTGDGRVLGGRWRVGFGWGLAAGMVVAGSLSKSQPFSNEVVVAPGAVLDMEAIGKVEHSRVRLDMVLRWSGWRYNIFYYSHAKRVRALLADGRPIPCSFNNGADDLDQLVREGLDGLPPEAAVGLATCEIGRWHVEQNMLSFLSRRAVIAWTGLDGQLEAKGREIGALVTRRDGRYRDVQVIPECRKAEVLTLRPGESARQSLILSEPVVGLSALTGTFDKEGVVLGVGVRSRDAIWRLEVEGVRVLNNAYTILWLDSGAELGAGEYELTLTNDGERPVAVYVNAEHRSSRRSLEGVEDRGAKGDMIIRATVEDPKWNRRFEYRGHCGEYWLWWSGRANDGGRRAQTVEGREEGWNPNL
ncbi:MAG: ArnT family glycosyltransferase [Dehalococcoidia bacterium]